MSDNGANRDQRGLAGFHAIAQQRGDGLLPELAGLVCGATPETECPARAEVTNCEIVTLPGLHERSKHPACVGLKRVPAQIIEFPAPKWQKNATRQA
ncbi:hypothetical protein FE840_016745 [Peteryoungia desertarenae]|uniref:Uncharacterized protein n=1 Tax=Peteryoungia desertarenae TaxID=1813451 RepID=A0ABX6QRJ5_9HYPH|nr:hypothetical protein [Peteryoungia desertarenae]QLF71067.1 hypothetical protein FE840_016745 [Peteryoungia desertarenae]